MRSTEIVLHEPFSQVAVEDYGVSRHVSETDKFILECTIESFVDRIVLGGFDPRPVVLKVQLLAGGFKVPVEFGAIVSLDVLDLPIKEDMEAVEEILGGGRTVGGVHACECNLGVPIDGGEDISFLAFPVAYHSIETEEKSGHGFSLQFGDLFSSTGNTAFAVDPCLFCWFIVTNGVSRLQTSQ
jgi:hypothetical protein